MAAVDQIRRTIRLALASADESAIVVAKALELERNYLRDFLKGKKASLNLKASIGLSERYGIPLADLTPTKEVPTIRKGARVHLYITEHMEARGLDDHKMASRIDGISPNAIAKWRDEPTKLQEWQVSAVLQALDLDDVADLAKRPAPAKPPQQAPTASRKRA